MKNKLELVYAICLFIVFELMSLTHSDVVFLLLVAIGLFIVCSWIFTVFLLYPSRKISRYSEEIVKLKLRERWFQYLFIPIVFFISVAGFIYLIRIDVLVNFAILMSSICYFLLFVYIKMTFQKKYSVGKLARLVFDYTCLLMFFYTVTILHWGNVTSIVVRILLVCVISFLILISNLELAKKTSVIGIQISLLSAVLIGVFECLTNSLGAIQSAFFVTIGFYVLLSFYNIRLAGERSLSKYLVPMLFATMSILIIM